MSTSKDFEYSIELLEKSIQSIEKEIPVYEEGIREILEEVELLHDYQKALKEAVAFAKEANRVIALHEFKRVRLEMAEVIKILRERRLAINKIKNAIEDKKRDILHILEEMEKIRQLAESGKLLEFKRKT